LILHNATIHSPIERFATALHVEEGLITWMGDEDTAAYRARAHPEARLIDAERALITPAFHDASAAAQPANALHRTAITAAHIHLGSAPDTSGYGPHLDLVGIHTDLPSAGPALHRLTPGADAMEMERFLRTDRAPLVEPALTVASAEDAAAFAELVAGGRAPSARVYLHASQDVAPELLATWSVVVIIDGEINLRLADLARAGVPFALTGAGTPWETIARALLEGPAPISARAAFNAHTRGAWRLTPGQFEPRGVLRVGAPADLASWHVEALAVQAPDERAAHWSTDERAGTPLLPYFGAGEPEPRLLRLWHRGVELEAW